MLHAVDTNVLARALITDRSKQGQKASSFVRDNDIFIAETVLLETEWLLRSQLGVTRKAVNAVMLKLLALENANFQDSTKIANALLAHKDGMDFADALHLLNARDCDEMISFDREFAKRGATLLPSIPVREP